MVSQRDTADGNTQLMRGFAITGGLMALAKASGPHLATVGAESAQWLMLAVMFGVSYGLFLAATSPTTIAFLEWIERAVGSNVNAD